MEKHFFKTKFAVWNANKENNGLWENICMFFSSQREKHAEIVSVFKENMWTFIAGIQNMVTFDFICL